MSDMIKRLARLRVSGLADQFDKLGLVPPVLARELQPVGPHVQIAGYAFCVKGRKLQGAGWQAMKVPRDGLYDGLAQKIGAGAVLMFDTGGYDDTAVFGAGTGLGMKLRDCAGAVIDGAVRDVDELVEMGLPTRARSVSAIRFGGRFAVMEVDCTIEMRGMCGPVSVSAGDLVLADNDGIIVVPIAMAEQVMAPSEKADGLEALIQADMRGGMTRQEASRHRGKS
ncbi:MAG: RraA family protein [Betaproteobacteria bacterium]|nr:RraA family protein [Betaproteobacteria bacterium]